MQLEASSGAEVERLRTRNDALAKLARTLQQEVKALKGVRTLDADGGQGSSHQQNGETEGT